MLERAIIVLGCLIGLAAGYSFYLAADQLRLPALLFFIVDLFGTLPGAIVAGLLTVPVAVGLLVLGIDWCFPEQPEPPGR